jgi:hypothetical protein
MDVQVLDVLKQLNKPVVKSAKRAMASIRATIDGVCIEGALSLLRGLGYEDSIVHKDRQKWLASDLRKEIYFPDLQGRLACETGGLWFWGGPPSQVQWYQGTLQTLLHDRVLCEIDSRGVFKIAELIGTDPGDRDV